MNWDYQQPVSIRFGKGRRKEIVDIAKSLHVSNGLLVATPFFMKNGLAKEMLEESQGLLSSIFADLSPNPDVKEVDCLAEVIREKRLILLSLLVVEVQWIVQRLLVSLHVQKIPSENIMEQRKNYPWIIFH